MKLLIVNLILMFFAGLSVGYHYMAEKKREAVMACYKDVEPYFDIVEGIRRYETTQFDFAPGRKELKVSMWREADQSPEVDHDLVAFFMREGQKKLNDQEKE